MIIQLHFLAFFPPFLDGSKILKLLTFNLLQERLDMPRRLLSLILLDSVVFSNFSELFLQLSFSGSLSIHCGEVLLLVFELFGYGLAFILQIR